MTARFLLQLPESVLNEARAAAAEAHVSVDDLLTTMIAEGMAQRRGLNILRDRASRGKAEAALSILDKVPDVEPDRNDRLI